MTAAELIAELSKVDGSTMIVMSQDGEGNGYSPLSEVDFEAFYEAESAWSGHVVHPEDIADRESEGRDADELVKVVCLWPVN